MDVTRLACVDEEAEADRRSPPSRCSWCWPAWRWRCACSLAAIASRRRSNRRPSAALGHPVTIRAAVPRLLPRVGLDLTGITIGAGARGHDRSGAADDRVPRAARRPCRGCRDLGRAQPHRRALGPQPARRARRCRAQTTTTTAPPALTIESIGSLALRDVTLVAGARTLLVDLDSSFTGGDRFVVSRHPGPIGGLGSRSPRASSPAWPGGPGPSRSTRRRSTSMG